MTIYPAAQGRRPAHPKEKLPLRGATPIGKGSRFHSIPEVSQAFDEAVPLNWLGPRYLVHGSVLQHVIDGRADRSHGGENGFLGAAVLANCRPGASLTTFRG